MGSREDASSSMQQRSEENRQFTTVGSVWQPQSQPMQPPERRGRTLKSFMSQPFDSEFSSFTDNGVPSFDHSSPDQYSNEYYSHRHPHQQLPHHIPQYSPLQQNFDRAVSPIQLSSPIDPYYNQSNSPAAQQVNSPEEYYYGKSANMSGQQKRVAPVIPVTPLRPVQINKVEGSNKRDEVKNHGVATVEEDSEDEDLHITQDMFEQLLRMPTKSLNNLATFENPMQKAAKRILAKAREAPSASGNQAYPQTGHFRPPPGIGSDSEQSFSERAHNPFGPSPSVSAARDSSYPAILSRGPGAPQPLTAGPPGQRQFRPTGFETWNTDKTRSLETMSPDYKPLGSAPVQPRTMHAGPQQSTNPPRRPEGRPPANRWGATTIPWGMNAGKASDQKITDTLTAEEAIRFYPQGLPADFNFNTVPIADDWQERRLREVEEEEKRKNPMLMQQSPRWQAERKAQVDRDFYGGNNMINKSFNMAVHEQESRAMVRAIGSEMKESKKAEGRIENRKLTVQQADDIPARGHAEPLLSMLYQTMAERPGDPFAKGRATRKPDGSQQ
ncbi:hypothetical protein F4821DRAFT_275139 [Hypoxylon rubiginosum]|uniref:Uncharacterized protein n=1 Tax=Hypoxylon rubiginosum TaxID=110542 RepID=A0ACC0CLH5_9PEZI|nr:hypothetical protein F4821DRAFT_275139 [Hypoxylon rubiginosum]